MVQQLAEGVVRLGSDQVNWYLVEDGGGVTVVDAGVPRFRPQLDEGLRLLGRQARDVAAVVLTHAHADHVGCAEPLRTSLAIPVHVHREDDELARTKKPFGKNEASLLPYLRHRQAWRLLAHLLANGGATIKKIGETSTFEDGAMLDVPGRPRVIHTPGHTPGHVALHFATRGLLAAGDLLCTFNPLTAARGPQLMPSAFNLSSATILDSLARIEDVDAPLTVFGHGEPWRESPAAAVADARSVGPT
jgi:glyoxylase-like metal-dependent hydrolase (beta-lactamase superfamily II)